MKRLVLNTIYVTLFCAVWCAPALAQFKAQDIQTYTLSGGGVRAVTEGNFKVTANAVIQ